MATGRSGCGGTCSDMTPSVTDARHTVSAGRKNSDFHDAGPTAQPKSSGSPPCSMRYRPGAWMSCQPAGRSADARHLAVHDGAIAHHGPDGAVPELAEQRDELIEPLPVDDRIVSLCTRPTYASTGPDAADGGACGHRRRGAGPDQWSTVPPMTVARSTRRLE